ncbi:MAG: porin [Frankiales bacterium]|jgi:aquaporin Z|nr:porin [Frankiales bacterium]
MRRYTRELIGSFGLMFTIGAVLLSRSPFAPFVVGAAYAGLLCAGGRFAAGHYNPAVSLAMLLRGRLASRDLLPYWAAQVVGAAAGAGVANFLYRPGNLRALEFVGARRIGVGLVAEGVVTFLVAYVFLTTVGPAVDESVGGRGIPVGLVQFAGAAAVGPLSGAAFNPAVAVGAAILGLFAWTSLWVYVVAALVGAVAAAAAAGLQSEHDDPDLEKPAASEETAD